jgi:aminopeptidase YwaD
MQNIREILQGSYILITAHHDRVSNSPGANDNALGSALLLSIAETLIHNNDKINVKFVSFGLEKVGLVGSEKYASQLGDEEIKKIKSAINLDCGLGQI